MNDPAAAPPPAAPPAPDTPPAAAPPASSGPDTRVPLSRFQEVVAARDAALAQAATVAEQVSTFQQAATTATAEAATLREDLALAEAGLAKPEARVVARALWGTLPEAERPELVAWAATVTADPSASPVALRGYLTPASPASAEPPPGSAPAAGGGAGLPASSPANPATPPPTSATAQLDAANAAFKDAMNSRDPAAMSTARANLERALGAIAQRPTVR